MKKFLQNLFTSKKEKEVKKKNTLISSLAPKILTKKEDIEKIQPYLDKLNETIDTKGINNIALTGAYGSGKSTIIGTFKELNPQYEFLNISLASFNKKKIDEDITPQDKKLQKEELERLLEVSILQQIFYHVKPDEIPESRFKRIINIPDWKIWSISIGFILWVSSAVLLLKYDYLDKINPNNWNTKNSFDWFALFIFIIAFIGLGLFSKLIIKLFSNSKINKVNIKGELELGDNVNKSVFNEHLEEILYFFERTEYNVVIIEDLDRFDSTDIFTKLREINILLNNSKLIKREINFVYAVGDDLFNDKKERVKFFEYIIPVIPFINSSNANEQLKTLIKESDLEENVFTKEFLSDITTFIDDIDMRLLINIFHEFVIYRNVLGPDALIGYEAELFAIITYKNIDPEDFNKLNSKEGKLYTLINNKKNYIQKLVSNIESKKTALEAEIKIIKDENISDINELKAIYIIKIIENITSATELHVNERKVRLSDLLSDNLFNEVINTHDFRYYQNGHGVYRSGVSFENIQNNVDPNLTYKKRAELIENKHKNRIDSLQKEIEKLRIEKLEIENWDLKQVFKEIDINEYLNDFSNNGLLRNLILEGYINEKYNDYISLFHEVSLTKEDKIFERNVKSGISDGFYYKLTHIENLIDNHIDQKYFSRATILNFDLLDYLAENYSRYSEKYNAIIKLLSNEKENSLEFIDQYIDLKRPITKQSQLERFGKEIFSENIVESINKDNKIRVSTFIKLLFKEWKEFWHYVDAKSNYDEVKKNYYLSLIIHFAALEDILSSQNKNLFAISINERPYFLSILKSSKTMNISEKVTKLIEKLNIKFEKLDDPEEVTKELFEYVYNNNHYQINKDNIYHMIRLYGKDKEDNNFELSNYTTILESNCEPMIKYINSNINTYIEDVYLKLEQNKSDKEDTLIKLLNNEELDNRFKVKIIEKVETIITDLSKIENVEMKVQLLINYKIAPNWKNLIDYYTDCENKIDENLIGYLNSEGISDILSKLKLTKEDEKLEKDILVCEEIEDNIYSEILKSCYFKWNSLSFEHLSESKAISLIDRILTTTKSNYTLLRENFANNHITLIEKDFNKFFEKIEDFETDTDDILMLLKSDNITVDNRFKYISKLTEQTIVDDNSIAKKTGEIILIKSTKISFEFNTIESIIKNLDSTNDKVKLVNLYFNEFSTENIITLVKNISYNHSELFVKRKRPLFNDNSYNKELLTRLKTKGLINSFGNDEKDTTKIRAVANY